MGDAILIKRILVMAVFAGVLMSGYVIGDDDQEESRRLMQRGDILPLQEILNIIGKERAARVLEVELEVKDERPVYEIEFLGPDGKVWESKVDAATGEIIATEAEN